MQSPVVGEGLRPRDPRRTGTCALPKVSIVPGGTDISFCIIPSTSYWATFNGSLRDQSTSHTPKSYVDAHRAAATDSWLSLLYPVFYNLVRVITLLTDFGTTDYYVAAMKGAILRRNPEVRIVDISHEIAPQSILSAAYVLFGAYENFPEGTIHLVVVDPGVGSTRQPVAAKIAQHYFVGPDNGVFSFVLRRAKGYEAFKITNRNLLAWNISNTFHGRDVFAPIAAALSLGVPLSEIGERLSNIQLLPESVPVSSSLIESSIIHIDRFGNCVTGIARGILPGGELASIFTLEVGRCQIRQLKRFYLEEVRRTEGPFVIWGSIGFLEISLVSSSAAELLGLKIGDPVRLHHSATAE